MQRTHLAVLLLVGLTLALAAPAQAAAPAKASELPPSTIVSNSGDLITLGTDTTAPSILGTPLLPSYAPGNGMTSYRQGSDFNQVVVGEDTRQRNTPTTIYPLSAVVKIESDGAPCSGAMIDTNLVLTAGHCLHGGRGGIWLDSGEFVVLPGVDGTTRPYGTCGAVGLYSVTGWTERSDPEYDYGVIRLDCHVGWETGWFGASTTMKPGLLAYVTGYPAIRPAPIRTQWWAQGERIGNVKEPPQELRTFRHFIDTDKGQSGGPMWNYNEDNPCFACIEGVHLSGSNVANTNAGLKIWSSVIRNLAHWRDTLN